RHSLRFLFLASLSVVPIGCKDFLKEEMGSTIPQDYIYSEKGLDELVVANYNILRRIYGFVDGPVRFETGNDIVEPLNNQWAIYSPAIWSPGGEAGDYANNLIGYFQTQLLGAYPIINDCNKDIEIIQQQPPGKYETDPAYA